MNKRNVLIFTKYYLPGYKAGGPIRSISNLVENLSDEFNFFIVTKDRDSFETRPYDGIESGTWEKVGAANVYYISPTVRKLSIFKSFLKDNKFHIIYLNSFFDFGFSFLPLLILKFILRTKKMTILAPRGEFSAGALRLKGGKKRAFLVCFNLMRLQKSVLWQATSKQEIEDIFKIVNVGRERIFFAPNFPSSVSGSVNQAQFNGVLKIIYLSRISPKKNLHYALKILEEVNVKVQFDIYGLIDDEEYWRQCEHIIKNVPSNISIEYFGPISHERVRETMSNYHLFLLPTKGENYGHVIVEALTSGLPVLISDLTPWKNLKKDGVGWDISLNEPNEYKEVITNYYMLLERDNSIKRDKVIEWITDKLDNDAIKEAHLLLFNS